jgi:hypothetical protein
MLMTGDTLDDILASILTCIAHLNTWINSNMMKLNRNKTEFSVCVCGGGG